jgi:hypothetical protein
MIFPHSQIWTPETIGDIHSKAQGEYRLSGFNPFREIPHFDELVFLASGLTRFPLEGYKEKCKTETVLGARFSSFPLTIDTPIYITSNSNLPSEVRKALAKGSSLVDTALSIGGKMFTEERKAAKKLIYEISVNEQVSKSVRAIKAAAIQVNASFQTSIEQLAKAIKSIRIETERSLPIFVNIPAGRVREDVRAAAKVGADAIVLQGFKAATSLTPESLLDYCRMPMPVAIVEAREALRESKLLGEVNLVDATSIRNGADAAKALALGADAVISNESALIAMGYNQLFRGISLAPRREFWKENQDDAGALAPPIRADEKQTETIDPNKGGELVAKFINSMTMEMALLARSLGKGDLQSLEYEDLSALTVEASMMTGIKFIGE